MTEPNPGQEAISTAQALTGALEGVGEQLKAINERQDTSDRRQRRDRILILLTILSLVIDFTVTGLYIANSVKLDHATSALHTTTTELQHTRATVAEVHQTLITGCLAGNANKAGQVQIWRKLASLSPPAAAAPGSAAARQEEKVQQFLAYVARVDAPRDCAAAYKIGGKP